MICAVQGRSGLTQEYGLVTKVRVDADGNLRIYRRRRGYRLQDVFHPAGEWYSYTVYADLGF